MADRSETRGAAASTGGGGSGWALAFALALLGLALFLVLARYQAPAPRLADVPIAEFSAGRAREVLRTLLGDGSPHPVGSAANARVRERILAQLRWAGYAPEVQEDFVCSPGGHCARVSNVIARLPGREPGKAVLLMAHYDSVPAGPGASDDLAGVAAVLEVARVLKNGPPLKNTVLFLLDDGEEVALLGAEAFAASPRAGEVGAVVNLEARGSSGPSLLFETSGADGWMIPLVAARLPRPTASSVFATVYDFLPNDTDLTVFKRRGVPGLNFAYILDPLHYHTPVDDFENASPASLQHHGDNALAAVRALAGADLASPPPGDAVFFDLLAFRLVHWPAGWSLGLALLALVLVLAAVLLGRRGGALSGGSLGVGLLLLPVALLLSGAVAFGVVSLLSAVYASPWVANPAPAKVATWLLALASSLFAASFLARWANPRGLWAGVWIGWSLLGLLLAFSAPGLSYLFILPALAAGLLGLAGFAGSPGSAAGRALAAIVPGLVAAVLWFPLLVFLYDGLGINGLVVTAVLLAFVFSTLGPLAGGAGRAWQRWLPLAAGAFAVGLIVAAALATPFTAAAPRPLPLQFHQDADTGAARFLSFPGPPIPQPMREAAQWEPKPVVPYPWSNPQTLAFTAPAPTVPVMAPELVVVSDSVAGGKRHLRLRLSSPRGAPLGVLYIPGAAKAESIQVEGRPVPPPPPAVANAPWRSVTHHTLPPGGAEISLVLGETGPLDWYVADRSFELPPGSELLRLARPDWAVPYQTGDTSQISRKVRI